MLPLSIITINYNNASGLQKTIETIVTQTFKNFEYIIIDGASTDNSVEVIKKFADSISYWTSEKDSGIFNAMNKGIERAKGEYILFVNSGDDLIDENILNELSPLLHTAEIIYGNYLVKDATKNWIKNYPSKLNFSHFFYDSLPHSAGAFIKTSGFKNELSKYDESLKVVSDWLWYVLAIYRHNYTYKHVDKIIGIYDHTGNSAKNPEITKKEKTVFFKNEFPEIYAEISELLNYKSRYITLADSRLLKVYLKVKNLFKQALLKRIFP